MYQHIETGEILSFPELGKKHQTSFPDTGPDEGWLAENGYATYIPPVVAPVITSITMRQARLILLQYGLLDAVNTTVTNIGGAAAIEWEYAGTVDRSNPLVAMVAAGAGMSEAQIDTMFSEGAVL